MTNEDLIKSRLADAHSLLEYANQALEREHFHLVVQFSQRAGEMAVKALLAYEGTDVPYVHDLAKLASKLPIVRKLPAEQQSRFYSSNRELARQRLTATYGTEEGTPPNVVYGRSKADEALAQGQFIVNTVESLIISKE